MAWATSLVSRTWAARFDRVGAPSARAARKAISTAPSMNEATSMRAAGSRWKPAMRAWGSSSDTSGRSW